jgi:histone-lysine N-methyltransferase SETD3
MSDYAAIALHLIAEKNDGDDSFWAPYIAVLPTADEIGCSALWEKEELEQFLDGSPLNNMSQYIRMRLGEEYQSLKDTVMANNPDTFPLEVFSLSAYEWAYAILFSRAAKIDGFPGLPEFVCLMPYIDLINHNPNADTYIVGMEEGVNVMGMGDKERFILVRADKYYDQYEQVYISYGKKSNAQLLLLYGFCLERNAGDFLEVPMGHLLDGDPLAEAKKRWLEYRKIPYDEAFPLYRDRFVSEMMQFLRLLVIQPEDLGLPANAPDLVLDKALNSINFKRADAEVSERRALLILRGICEELLSKYGTTLDEDERLIGDRTMFDLLPKKQRMAMRVRYGEKLILRAVMTTLDRVMNNLGTINELNDKRARMQQDMWGRLGFDFDSPAIKASNLEELMQELDI